MKSSAGRARLYGGIGGYLTICRSYLPLVRTTVDLLYCLTKDIQEPFLKPELTDSLVCMLDAVLEQLTNGVMCKYV